MSLNLNKVLSGGHAVDYIIQQKSELQNHRQSFFCLMLMFGSFFGDLKNSENIDLLEN